MTNYNNIKAISIAMVGIGIPLLFAFGLWEGELFKSWGEGWQVLTSPSDDPRYVVLMELRLPRLLTALLAGGILAVCGYLMQVLVQNPLADPYTLGLAGGASLGANVVYLGVVPMFFMGVYLPPVFAFLGCFGVVLLLFSLSSMRQKNRTLVLLIGGVSLSSFCTALVSLMIYLADRDDAIRTVVFWALGSLEHASWTWILPLLIASVILVVVSEWMFKPIQLYMLGEQRAYLLGLHPSMVRLPIMSMTSLGVGLVVASCGPIGFVGLIIPHFVRAIIGTYKRFHIIFVFIAGGGYLLLCEIIAHAALPPSGLPIGVVTSLLGIPMLVYLVYKQSYRF